MKFDISIFFKTQSRKLVSLKSDKNNGHLIRRPAYIYNNISLNSSHNQKCLWKNCTEILNTHFMFNNFIRNGAVYEIIWQNIVMSDRATDDNMTHANCMLDT